MKNSLVIILLGPPGSGKGTQAELLAEKLNLYYLETSKILEEKFKENQRKKFIKIDSKKYYFQEEKKLWQTGFLCSPPFVTFLVKNKIKELAREDKNLVLAGSPRTIYEGKEVIPLLKKIYGKNNIKIILIKTREKESIFRNTKRRICQLMRHPILYSKETINLKKCPLDGSRLIKRKGLDNPKTIRVRLKEYQERTFPLLEYFKKEGLKIKEIDGEQPVVNVFKDILGAL